MEGNFFYEKGKKRIFDYERCCNNCIGMLQEILDIKKILIIEGFNSKILVNGTQLFRSQKVCEIKVIFIDYLEVLEIIYGNEESILELFNLERSSINYLSLFQGI